MQVTKSGARTTLWVGRSMSAIASLFLAFDSLGKLLEVQDVLEGTAGLGYPVGVVFGLGLLLLACLTVYAIPATALLGAVLLTGYLGGAVATHLRVGNPWFSHTLFPVYVGVLVWGGLLLRDARLRSLLPLRMGE